jgi:GNAT superfamily N-acetyltransferase
MEEALTSTEIGVMAIASDGQPVGMARVTGDGMYYMIWDVIVRPEHQGRRIGATLLEAALREIRGRARPGAFVGLFTDKPGFYETLGFKSGGGMHRQV